MRDEVLQTIRAEKLLRSHGKDRCGPWVDSGRQRAGSRVDEHQGLQIDDGAVAAVRGNEAGCRNRRRGVDDAPSVPAAQR